MTLDESFPEDLLHADLDPVGTPNLGTQDDPQMRALLMHFDSLGANCEFGLVQRYYGAEPLGLLRWANVVPEKLVELLTARFAGYGDARTTELLVSRWGEIMVHDRTFRTARHSFVKDGTVDRAEFLKKECRRLAFLRDKLVGDLADSEKCFVYHANRLMTDGEVAAIHAAVRRYGSAPLLLVQLAAPEHPAGSVENLGDGLLMGRLDRFGVTADGRWNVSFSCWKAVVERAAALASERPSLPAAAVTSAVPDAALQARPDEWIAAWRDFRDQTPDSPAGPAGLAAALRELGRLAEAEAIARDAVERWPADAAVVTEAAKIAAAQTDWQTAIRRWAMLRLAVPDRIDGYLEGAKAAQAAIDPSLAEAILEDGRARFPKSREIAVARASLAVFRADWEEALRRWHLVCAEFPTVPDGFVGATEALEKLDRYDEADELVASALKIFPKNYRLLVAYASGANRRGDVTEIMRRWASLRQVFSGASYGFLGAIQGLRKAGALKEQTLLLAEALKRFPGEAALISEAATAAEAAGDWPEALSRWESFKEVTPQGPAAYSGIATALLRLGRAEDASAFLTPALRIFPDNARLHVLHAQTSSGLDDGLEAQARWRAIRERFPDLVMGWMGAVAELRLWDRFSDAEALLSQAAQRFPTDLSIACEYARSAEQRKNFTEAIARWGSAVERFPAAPEVHVGLAKSFWRGALAQQQKIAEGDIPEAKSELVLTAQAEIAELEQRPLAAEKAWRACTSLFPQSQNAHCGLALVLRKVGNLDDAEMVAERAQKIWPDAFRPARTRAIILAERKSWSDCLSIFADLAARFKSGWPARTIREDLDHYIPLARLDQGVGAEGNAKQFEIPQTITQFRERLGVDRAALKRLMMRFENLGSSGGKGCEFGNVQRRFGADPLSLLRWASVPSDGLIDALSKRFEGVGSPAQTDLSIIGGVGEYFIYDRRFKIASHTFTLASQVDREVFFAQQCRRWAFLGRKLVEDLGAPEKIYVYKCVRDVDAVGDIYARLLDYDIRNKVLFVKEATDKFPSGTVERLDVGMFLGRVQKFSMSSTDVDSWVAICQKTCKFVDA